MEQGACPAYELVRSARRSIGIEVRPDGSVLVRAPRHASRSEIESALRQRADWIGRAQARQRDRAASAEEAGALDAEALRALAAQAKAYIPGRVALYAPRVGVRCGRITIRAQRSRWGSCSSAGNLSFNCLLMLTPPEVIDSVVVHELCHRRHMDHSAAFYREVERVFPEYRKWNAWLKQNGPVLLARARMEA